MSARTAYQSLSKRRSRHLSVRGVEYCLHEWGNDDAPPLLLLHGWGDSGATFQFVVDAFSHDWHVLAPDWRGFGDSAHSGGPYWFPDYLADLNRLLEIVGLQLPLPIVGHSLGGNVASLYAGIFPASTAALINIEGFGLPDSDPADAPGRYRRFIAAAGRESQHPGYTSADALLAGVREGSPGISDQRARYVVGCWTRRGDDGRLHLKADMAHRWPNAVLYRRAEAEACWRAITAPTLLVSGADSAFATHTGWPQDPALYPRAERQVIEAAGHMLHFEQPAALAAAIEGFLLKNKAPTTRL